MNQINRSDIPSQETNKIWLAFDKDTGQCLTEIATTADAVAELMKSRKRATGLRTVATHTPGQNVNPEELKWLQPIPA